MKEENDLRMCWIYLKYFFAEKNGRIRYMGKRSIEELLMFMDAIERGTYNNKIEKMIENTKKRHNQVEQWLK